MIRRSSFAFRSFAFTCILLLAFTCVVAQEEFPPPPDANGEPEKKKGSLQPRPEDDPKTALWVAKLGAARPQPLSTRAGILLHHVMSPDGARVYYFREESRSDGRTGKPAGVSYALYTVGAEKAESKVAETGADTTPPLFLGDDRILFCARRYDSNEDAAVDELDDASLMVCNLDGGNLRGIATLKSGETPVAVRNEREVLVSTAGDTDVNGWIVSINLVRGDRTNIVRGFNVELVLDDGRLVVERQKAPPAARPVGDIWNPWGEAVPETEVPEQPLPSLLDPSEHFIFDPKDSSETVLYGGSKRSRLVVSAEGSFFGHQEPSEPSEDESGGWGWFGPENISKQMSEILIVDDPAHHDTRSPSARYNYQVIGWITDRGLLVIEQGKLGSRLLLFDHALKTHRLADFELNARGFVASKDGLTIAWLEIEDTDKNGYLEPWKDHSRISFTRIE